VSHKPIKKGDLVRLDPEKYGFCLGNAIVLDKQDQEGWEIVTVYWVSRGYEDQQLPTDLKVVG